jgi:hypothetical protein
LLPWGRLGLFSPPYPIIETIRNQTLPRAITDWRVSPQFGGERTYISRLTNGNFVPEPTFVAFLDGMDSGAVLGYSPYRRRQSWNAVSLPFWHLT